MPVIMSDTKNYGIVYLLTNPCMPGIVKIGKTSRTDLQNRMKELYTTGVPVPFEQISLKAVPTKDWFGLKIQGSAY